MVHPQPKYRKDNQFLNLMLIIMSLVCKFDIKGVNGNYPNPFFEKKIRRRKHPWEVYKCRNSVPYIGELRICSTASAQKGQATIGDPFLHQLDI